MGDIFWEIQRDRIVWIFEGLVFLIEHVSEFSNVPDPPVKKKPIEKIVRFEREISFPLKAENKPVAVNRPFGIDPVFSGTT